MDQIKARASTSALTSKDVILVNKPGIPTMTIGHSTVFSDLKQSLSLCLNQIIISRLFLDYILTLLLFHSSQ